MQAEGGAEKQTGFDHGCVMAGLQAALSAWPTVRLRDEAAADLDFVVGLYTDYRWEELAAVPWPEAAKREFLKQQAELQLNHYRHHYLGAAYWIVEEEHNPIGRLYLYASADEYRLMDIMLVDEWRGRGLGTALLLELQQRAAQERRRISLHVEPQNPAQRLYARLGFQLLEARGAYDFLAWSPG